jgi:toxin CptA
MRSSPDSSPSCWTCRLEWRPSRLLVAALGALGALAAAALMTSGLPMPAKFPAAIAAAACGAVLAAREATRAVGELAWSGHGQPAHWSCAGGAALLHDVQVLERGPLLRLQGRDPHGRMQRLLWWPDTLTRTDRRALRLASGVSRRSAKPLPSMAA